ncbi:phospholipase D family protein [Ruegeria sp. HKCCA0235A]|uniref:phospholipase D family protein n=1 Tax=Ruegeria sp. HKCCA0235A TaxID=2682998 RepID=UPI001487D075|nr:phospholipase D family protein [Ruegeria sp. HKCCA0235A]
MAEEMLGDQLLKLVSSAKEKVVLVAPFIKAEALSRVLDVIPNTGQKIICVTRWRPEDIVDGVCDLEIFEVVSNRANGELWMHSNLHAKYFRADQSCLIGSANLTGRALGWRLPTNLELLVEIDVSTHGIQAWEASLMRTCTPVTAELRDKIAKEVKELEAQRPKLLSIEVEHDDDPSFRWVPLCPSPEKLFKVYTGELDEARMVKSAFEFAQRDLRSLGPPRGYSEAHFLKHVADRLQNLEVVQKVVSASSAGLSDIQAAELIADYIEESSTIDPGDAWKVLKRWMMHFFPEQYRIEVGQEILVKSRIIAGH